jgi:hypothetical protein
MPTGTGKTTVLMTVAFLLRAERVLVLTPSRLVREQIAENFSLLADLKKIGALAMDVRTPRVFATDGLIGTDEAWEDLRQYDVVVATVPSVSPRDGAVPEAPADLFDVVLVDEAHHAPARTWSRLLDLLRGAKQILFTATPFRRDEKEIRGKFVFTYDLRRAHQDRVFGDIAYEPVSREGAESIDVAIARATERRFQQDRDNGLEHLVMVRTDSLRRAKELKAIYDASTNLRLAFVNGQHTLKHVKGIIQELNAGMVDGIVCVNMFGEGFNLPRLKIAAVHSPHRSLAVTLQFIGRFARAGMPGIGSATFLAEPTESSEELGELYETGAVWRDIVRNLAEARVEAEVRTREILDSFDIEATPDMDDFSLYTIRPYFHAKVFAAPDGVDLRASPEFPNTLQVIFVGRSEPHGAAVYLTRESLRSAWSSDERFTNIAYDMFVFHENRAAGLLFICASRRHAALYSRLARKLVGGRPRPLSHSSISRALNDLEAAEFFSIGMRKRNKLGQVESYRMISGPSADKAIQESDGRLFDRGHCFGKALQEGSEVTIGVSTASKVWSNTYDRIPELLDWCDGVANRIASGRKPVTGSRIDLLSSGEELQRVPAGVIAMSWGADVFREAPVCQWERQDGAAIEGNLLDCALDIVDSQEGSVTFSIRDGEMEWRGVFAIGVGELFAPLGGQETELLVRGRYEDVKIAEYLNEMLPTFYCADLASIEGTSLYRVPENLEPFGDDGVESVDWGGAGVDITREKPGPGAGRSIFEWLRERLVQSDAGVVFCDDGSGEMADFIALSETPGGPRVAMFHCKASGGRRPGNRVEDLYEVCGQAVKSSVWMRPDHLLARLRYRGTLASIPGYLKGQEEDAIRMLSLQVRQQVQFDTYIVQPGIRRVGREQRVSDLLAAARSYLVQGGVDRFGVIGS